MRERTVPPAAPSPRLSLSLRYFTFWKEAKGGGVRRGMVVYWTTGVRKLVKETRQGHSLCGCV